MNSFIWHAEEPVFWAIRTHNNKELDKIISKGKYLNIRNGFYQETPLMKAVIYQNVQAVDSLLLNGAKINLINIDGNTALHLAVETNNLTIVLKLIEHGSDVTLKNKDGESPLDIAIYYNNEKIIDIITKVINKRKLK